MRMLCHAIQTLAHDQESSITKDSHPQTRILHESCILHEHAWHDPDFSPLRVLKKWHPAPRYRVNDLYAGAHCLIHLIEAHLTIKDRPRTLCPSVKKMFLTRIKLGYGVWHRAQTSYKEGAFLVSRDLFDKARGTTTHRASCTGLDVAGSPIDASDRDRAASAQ